MVVCPVCGIDETAISVADATDAIRTFPRRYREALADVADELLRLRPEAERSSMLGHAMVAREELELLAGYLPPVLSGAGPTFPPVAVDADGHLVAAGPGWAANPDLVLAGIGASCADLVEQITAVPVAAWDRPFTVGDDAHTAGWIPRHAAHLGAHHLRDIARVRAVVER